MCVFAGVTFQPTRPVKGATYLKAAGASALLFQPTRPVKGATWVRATASAAVSSFNPRAP